MPFLPADAPVVVSKKDRSLYMCVKQLFEGISMKQNTSIYNNNITVLWVLGEDL
jgi:hypothetical protein